VTIGAPADARLVSKPFAPHSFVIVAPPTHRLVGRTGIPLPELENERFIVREPGSDTRDKFEQSLARTLELKAPLEFKNTEAIKHAVIAGMGVSFVSANTVELEVRAGLLSVLDVAGFPWACQWHLVHRTDKQLEPAAAAFRRFLLEEGATRIAGLTKAAA
jgi:DNA-binding transcriptional LysR family regulator